VKTPLFATVLLLAAAGASAQTIVTKVDLEGHPSFSDHRDAGALPQTEPAQESDAPPPVRRLGVNKQRGAAINAKEAERRLTAAQLKRQQGMEPLPGELNPETGQPNIRYWRRQEKLRQGVEDAQRRVIATRSKVSGPIKQSQSGSSKQSQM
jgi:hypothetical protein